MGDILPIFQMNCCILIKVSSLRVQLAMIEFWFRQWYGAEQATHRLSNHWWPISLMHICVFGPQCVKLTALLINMSFSPFVDVQHIWFRIRIFHVTYYLPSTVICIIPLRHQIKHDRTGPISDRYRFRHSVKYLVWLKNYNTAYTYSVPHVWMVLNWGPLLHIVTKWRHRSGRTLARVITCCPTVPSHYLNQLWLTIKSVLWYSPESNFTRGLNELNPERVLRECISKITIKFLGGQ